MTGNVGNSVPLRHVNNTEENDHYLNDYINGCNVVGVSCTESGKTLLDHGFNAFDYVIIDEVSKATPPELLVQMLRGRKIVLVGDHRQLPPLFNEHEKSYQEIAEQSAEDSKGADTELTMEQFHKYKDMVTSSLFEKYFESAPDSIKETLTVQYRMHPDIMNIVNTFYDGKLMDGNGQRNTLGRKEHGLVIHDVTGHRMIEPEKHAYWFDSSEIEGSDAYEQQKEGSTSFDNPVEAVMAVNLLKEIDEKYAEMGRTGVPVGVISFYFDQVRQIRNMIQPLSFRAINVEVNTVDRFQGKEKEIVLVSLVRNSHRIGNNTKGYVAAFQRINVAFSRAENLLIILGATRMYYNQPVELTDMNNGEQKTIRAYGQIIDMLQQQGAYFTAQNVLTEDQCDEILNRIQFGA